MRRLPQALRLGAILPLALWSGTFSGQERPQPVQAAASPERQTAATAAELAAAIGDEERSALTFTRYDLDLHLRPAAAGISVLARVIIRNDGNKPLANVALQISSSLAWGGVAQVVNGRTEKLLFNTHHLQSDADYTGETSEAVIHLLEPLAVHERAELTLLYSGEIRSSAAAMSRSGSSASGRAAADWEVVSPEGTYLRGFGDVLWYPVASRQVFLGEGANLVHAAGEQMLRQAAAEIRLRLSVEYTGDAPETVFFCGRAQPLTSSRDNPDVPVADSGGVATADFASQMLGFRTPSLLITRNPVPVPGSGITVLSDESDFGDRLTSVLPPIVALLQDWIGPGAGSSLAVIDHPGSDHPGSAFVDTGLLVAPLSSADPETLQADLVDATTRTRFQSQQVWLDQGMAQFVSLLWIERTKGRPAALAALGDASHVLALAESAAPSPTASERGLLGTSDAVFYRSKAASVLWMLRDIVGDAAMKQALERHARDPRLDRDPAGFQKLLEEVSGKSLGWFFEDWVYHDRGLPELSIVSAAARELPSKTASGAGRLVAVEVRNDGGAAADVPVTVRSGALTATERLRVNAHAVASVRVLFQSEPEEVQVNDGTIPEMISGTHVQKIPSN